MRNACACVGGKRNNACGRALFKYVVCCYGYGHFCLGEYVCACACARVRARVRACVRVLVRVCVFVCVCARVFACVFVCARV